MKQLIRTTLALLLLANAVACQSKHENASTEMNQADSTSGDALAQVTYICSMHPEITSKEPGTCSKCGMEMIKKEANGEEHDHEHADSTSHE